VIESFAVFLHVRQRMPSRLCGDVGMRIYSSGTSQQDVSTFMWNYDLIDELIFYDFQDLPVIEIRLRKNQRRNQHPVITD
jgi:hypothetical protein